MVIINKTITGNCTIVKKAHRYAIVVMTDSIVLRSRYTIQ